MRSLLSILILAGLTSPLRGDLLVANYSPATNQRFYTGADRAYIGDPFDWSGIGRDSGTWLTMISPSYFVSANHAQPALGSTATFWTTNDLNGSAITRTVDGVWGTLGGSDLFLGHLSQPVTTAYYPVLATPNPVGTNLLVFGLDSAAIMRTGIGQVAGLGTLTLGTTGTVDTWSYDPNQTGSSKLVGGDSGGPSFTIVNGQPALVGVHWAVGGGSSYDTYVPAYATQLQSVMGTEFHQVSAIPEPSSIVLLGVGSLVVVVYRRARCRYRSRA